MKLINIILSLIVGIVIFLLFSSFLYMHYNSLVSHASFIYLFWTATNAAFSGYLGANIGDRFYKWFKSHIK